MIQTKIAIAWYMIDMILDNIRSFGIAHSDKNFSKILNDMENYIRKQLKLPVDTDVIDSYIVVEQNSPDLLTNTEKEKQ